jgi:mediator of RNA polymerase II transcription subunit 13
VATPNVGGASANGSGGSTCSNGADLYGIKKIVLPQKEYEEELGAEKKTAPPLLYDYSSMTAWLFHPVKRMKTDRDSHAAHNGAADRSADSSDTGTPGKHLNGNLGSESREMIEYDDDDGAIPSRKRKGPDSGVSRLNSWPIGIY